MYRATNFLLKPNEEQSKILGCMSYATSKLWNVANYERHNWKKDSGEEYPNWYKQKKELKNSFWFKNLPSQTSQQLLKVLDQSWKSFYELKKTKSEANPPRYKHENFNITFLNNGFKISDGQIRFAIPKQLRDYLKEKHGVEEKFIFIKVPKHIQMTKIKTIEIIPITKVVDSNNHIDYKVVLVQEKEETTDKIPTRNSRFMSIDIGISNAMTCYTYQGKSHIVSGKQWLSSERYYHKKIAEYRAISDVQQKSQGIKYPKQTRRVKALYNKKKKQTFHLLHCMSRTVVNLALAEGVDTIVIGNITGIRENANLGKVNNQKFHALPFAKLINLITYKAAEEGIHVDSTTITEEYTSQTCSVCKEEPNKDNAKKSNRKHRGLYICSDCGAIINADINGAINISKKYLKDLESQGESVVVLDTPVRYTFNGQQFY